MGRYSAAQNRATQKYIKSAYDEIKIRISKGNKDTIKAHAAKQGESLNGFVNRAISETMEHDEERKCNPYITIK